MEREDEAARTILRPFLYGGAAWIMFSMSVGCVQDVSSGSLSRGGCEHRYDYDIAVSHLEGYSQQQVYNQSLAVVKATGTVLMTDGQGRIQAQVFGRSIEIKVQPLSGHSVKLTVKGTAQNQGLELAGNPVREVHDQICRQLGAHTIAEIETRTQEQIEQAQSDVERTEADLKQVRKEIEKR